MAVYRRILEEVVAEWEKRPDEKFDDVVKEVMQRRGFREPAIEAYLGEYNQDDPIVSLDGARSCLEWFAIIFDTDVFRMEGSYEEPVAQEVLLRRIHEDHEYDGYADPLESKIAPSEFEHKNSGLFDVLIATESHG